MSGAAGQQIPAADAAAKKPSVLIVGGLGKAIRSARNAS